MPSARTTSADSRLSSVRPCRPMRWPMPPPRVRPATPVVSKVPPGIASRCIALHASTLRHVAPPPTRARRDSGSISTPPISRRSIRRPPLHIEWPATLWPPPRIAIGSPSCWAQAIAAAKSSLSAQHAITAGTRSIIVLNVVRATSYAGCSGASTGPRIVCCNRFVGSGPPTTASAYGAP